MEMNLVLLLEKNSDDQSKFIEALQQIDSAITCIASSDCPEAFYSQRWKAVFISVDDFIDKSLLYVERLVGGNKPLIVAMADTTEHKQACAEMGMDYFFLKPDNVSGWINILEPFFSSVLQLNDVLQPLM